jgi:hypothetical protein
MKTETILRKDKNEKQISNLIPSKTPKEIKQEALGERKIHEEKNLLKVLDIPTETTEEPVWSTEWTVIKPKYISNKFNDQPKTTQEQSKSDNGNPKTCYMWEKGNCRRGNQCWFQHCKPVVIERVKKYEPEPSDESMILELDMLVRKALNKPNTKSDIIPAINRSVVPITTPIAAPVIAPITSRIVAPVVNRVTELVFKDKHGNHDKLVKGTTSKVSAPKVSAPNVSASNINPPTTRKEDLCGSDLDLATILGHKPQRHVSMTQRPVSMTQQNAQLSPEQGKKNYILKYIKEDFFTIKKLLKF